MRATWLAAVAAVAALGGCGIAASDPETFGRAPTGVASGPTLYFLDVDGHLVAQQRDTGRLGSLTEALALLLTGPGGSDLRTDLPDDGPTRVGVTEGDGVLELRVPLGPDEAGEHGVDQLVCTAVATHVQAGGSPETTVRVHFTLPAPQSDRLRTCPAEPGR